jgi:DNA-binding NarL/FixJ family response regulator
VVHAGLEELLKGTEIEIAGHAYTGEQAIVQFKQLRPAVVLMDVRMPDRDGLQTLEAIRNEFSEEKIVMFSTHSNPTYVARAIALGADDYLLKSISADELIAAIVRTAAGQEPPEDSLYQRTRSSMRRRRDLSNDQIPLTNREMQVLRHVAMGLSNREIGKSLEISVETVKEHVQNILRKLDVNDRTQAAVWAVKRQLV